MFKLRRYFQLDPSITFLNHGSFGATPKPVFHVYQNWQRELEYQPVEFLGRRYYDLMRTARQALATFVGTDADNLVYTTNVTESINIVARSLDLGPGDEVLATDHEYGALDRAWRFLAEDRGYKYLTQAISVPLTTDQAFIDDIWKGVTSRTRVIYLSHITSSTGLRFPVERVAQKARLGGILTVVDGAHAPGQITVQLDELGVDFYGGNLHKWLCAPKGAGFLYARKEVQKLLKPLVVSWGYDAENPGPSMFIDHHEWTGTRDIAAFLSVPAAIEFQQKHDWEKVRNVCHELAWMAEQDICKVSGMSSISDESRYVQIASAPIPDWTDLPVLKSRLYDEFRIEVPLLLWNNRKLIRVSVQGYNSKGDIKKLGKAIGELIGCR